MRLVGPGSISPSALPRDDEPRAMPRAAPKKDVFEKATATGVFARTKWVERVKQVASMSLVALMSSREADPTPCTDPGDVTGYVRVVKDAKYCPNHEPLFPKPPRVTAIAQRELGDCALLASLASATAVSPGKVEQLVTRRGNRVEMAVFERPGQAELVQVESSLLNAPLATTRGPGEGRWVEFIEKAFAKHYGSYDHLHGMLPSDVLTRLTGRAYVGANPKEVNVWEILHARSHAEPISGTWEAKLVMPATLSTFFTPPKSYEPGWRDEYVEMHAFAIVAIGEDETLGRYVKLYNPFGYAEIRAEGWNDGVFRLPVTELGELFAAVYYAATTEPWILQSAQPPLFSPENWSSLSRNNTLNVVREP